MIGDLLNSFFGQHLPVLPVLVPMFTAVALLLMGDGGWLAGSVAEVMQASILGDYLGHPIEIIEHGKRKIFIPKEDSQ